MCTDIDECVLRTHTCGPASICNNTIGSFVCACNVGYRADAQSQCLNVNECLTSQHNCGAHANCSDTNGSFLCFCGRSGYRNKSVDGLDCVDTDECAMRVHNCHAYASVSFFCFFLVCVCVGVCTCVASVNACWSCVCVGVLFVRVSFIQ